MTEIPEQDLYEVLGVPATATGAELDHAFRALARGLHPDSGQDGGDSDAFQRVLAAYAVLRDPVARSNYDRQRTARGRGNRRRAWSRDITVRTGQAGEPLVRVGPVHRWE
ncbi:MAG TPA: J domain-containing protein [Kribbella sp.]